MLVLAAVYFLFKLILKELLNVLISLKIYEDFRKLESNLNFISPLDYKINWHIKGRKKCNFTKINFEMNKSLAVLAITALATVPT